MRTRKSDKEDRRRTKFGRALERNAKEILAHVNGEVKLPTRAIELPHEMGAKRIRTKARMSQYEEGSF